MVRTLSGPYLITTSPSLTTCRCGLPVLAATVVGLDRHVDTAALNDWGELAALLAGRKTYELHGEQLVPRSSERLREGRPADTPVLADHACTITPDEHVDDTFMGKAMKLLASLLLGAYLWCVLSLAL